MRLWRKLQHGDFGRAPLVLALALALAVQAAPLLALFGALPPPLQSFAFVMSLGAGVAVVWLVLTVSGRLAVVQEAVDETQSAFVVYDARNRLVISNRRYREALGLPDRAFVPGVPYVDLVRMSLEKTATLGTPVEDELNRRLRLQETADGVPSDRRYPGNRWLRVTKTRTARGANVGVAVDVTEYYGLLERLETEVARFSVLAQGAPVAIAQTDASGTLRFANDSFLAIFGAPSLDGLRAAGGDELAALMSRLRTIPNDGEIELVAGNERRDFIVRSAALPVCGASGDHGAEHITIFIDNTERKRSVARMRHLALHDALTGALNRVAFADDLAEAVAAATPEEPASLVAIDLDRFKPVNDLYGHLAGDELLRQVVARCVSALPDNFRIYRTGGDEFCVLAARCPRPAVVTVAETLLERIVAPFDVRGHRVRIGASLGISTLPDDARSGEALMHYADLAMYHVKELGGGRVARFDHHVLSSVDSRRVLEADLAAALQDRDLSVVFQPLCGPDPTCPVGAEALVRWTNRRTGMPVAPSAFIPAAEETGLVREMDLQVFSLAVGAYARWQAAGTAPPMLTVNMSTRTLETADVVEPVIAALRRAGVDGRSVVIEVTESFAVRDASDLCRTIRRLAEHGLRFAIDDFGTGYTSFRLLADLPIHFVKIDRSFVADLARDDCRSRAIVGAIVAVARDLRLEVIAEGVESEAQVAALRSLGCNLFQGWLFGRPQPAPAAFAATASARLTA